MMWSPYRPVDETDICPKCGGRFNSRPHYNNGKMTSVKQEEHLVWFCDICEYKVRTQCLDAGGTT